MKFFIETSDTHYSCEATRVYCGKDVDDAVMFNRFKHAGRTNLTEDKLEEVYCADLVEDYIRYKLNEYEKIDLYNLYAKDQDEDPIEPYDNAADYAAAKGDNWEESFNILSDLYENEVDYEGEYIKRGHYYGTVVGDFDDVFDESYYTYVAEWACDEGLYADNEIRDIVRMFENAEEDYDESFENYEAWLQSNEKG